MTFEKTLVFVSEKKIQVQKVDPFQVLRKRRDQQKQQMLNNEKSASLARSRPNSSINRLNKTASRSHVKKILVDEINSHGGKMLLEKLLDVCL